MANRFCSSLFLQAYSFIVSYSHPSTLFCVKTNTNPKNSELQQHFFSGSFLLRYTRKYNQAFIDVSFIEDAGRKQEHLHSGLYTSKQFLTRKNGHEQLVPLYSVCCLRTECHFALGHKCTSSRTLHKRMALLNAWALV